MIEYETSKNVNKNFVQRAKIGLQWKLFSIYLLNIYSYIIFLQLSAHVIWFHFIFKSERNIFSSLSQWTS